MKVQLISYTPDALDVLLFTKQTRLEMSEGTLDEVKAWPMEKKLKELAYMLGTIESSWEFVDYTFLISGVSRAFTHQFVRTRTGSYAQQSQRTVDMEGFEYITTGAVRQVDEMGTKHADTWGEKYRLWLGAKIANYHGDNAAKWYDLTMDAIALGYHEMRKLGVPPQDARGVLPTNVATNIVAKFNLRTMADTGRKRLCTRTQGEYQDVFRAMRAEVLKVHPWAEPFIRVHCASTGVCQFPNYMECPIKGPVFNPDTGYRWDQKEQLPATRAEIQTAWEGTRFEAVPHRTLPVLTDG